ncbi:MAG: hypothetical protein K0S32_504 [Bacteroidetes bacterium]|jgi:hypothetical protein|nr:hypothetical protein [Bacteroidota bacterium]
MDVKFFLIPLIACLCISNLTFAQTECDCSNDSKAVQYKNKMSTPSNTGEQKLGAPMGGNDATSCSYCAQIALYICLCNCETTNTPPGQIEQQIASLGKTIKGFQDQGIGNCCSEYAGISRNCPNAGKKKGGGNANNSNSDPKNQTVAEVNQDFVNFANMLAPFADNPEAAQMVKKLNNLHTKAQAAKDILKAGGAAAKTLQTVDNLERVGQVATVYGNLSQPSAEAQQKWKEQDESKESIKTLDKLLLESYQKSSTIPLQDASGKISLETINAFEKQINDYDNNTAMQRLLILRYNQYSEPPVITELAEIATEIQKVYNERGVNAIKHKINSYVKSGLTENHLLNADQSAMGQELLRMKAQYYINQGDAVQAAKLSKQVETQKALEKAAKEEYKREKRRERRAIAIPIVGGVAFGGLIFVLLMLLI